MYIVGAKFKRREDAEALKQLLIDMGVESYVGIEKPTPKYGTGCRTARDTAGARPKHETRAGRLVLGAMQQQAAKKVWTREEIALILEAAMYKAASASPLLSGLVREGMIDTIFGDGEYRLSSKGLAYRAEV